MEDQNEGGLWDRGYYKLSKYQPLVVGIDRVKINTKFNI